MIFRFRKVTVLFFSFSEIGSGDKEDSENESDQNEGEEE
jgi:hypothetical protein